ncbi:flippase-like domain-containing protein [Candidatus Bipolaricaulota bacterium]|nr:flippase-like domain-containing protein [Candidatus Bipolaricaulota bacterium]
MHFSRKTTTIVSVIVGLVILGGILWYIGPGNVINQVITLGWDGFGVIILSILGMFTFWTIAWIVIMRGYGVKAPITLSFWARIGSFAVSYLTPSMHFGGEPVRALVIERESDSSYSRIFATIVAERISMMTALVAAIVMGALFGLFSKIPKDTLLYLILISLLFVALLVTLIVNFYKKLFLFTRFIAFLKRHLPWTEWIEKAESIVKHLEQEINMAFGQHIKHTFIAFLFDLVATIFMLMRPQIYFYYTQGRLFSIIELTMLFALISILSSLFWITPGGIGISEGGLIGIFALFGIKGSEAVAYSFSIKVVEFFFVGVGLALLARYGIMNLLFQRGKESES